MRWTHAVVAGGLLVTSAAFVPVAQAREAAGVKPGVWTETAYHSVFKDSGPSPEARSDIQLEVLTLEDTAR